jgi:peptide/nickel transport system substrate-binding protein
MDPDSSPSRTEEFKAAALKERRLLSFAALERLLQAFSPGERLALYVCAILLGLSTFALLAFANGAASVQVPAPGGSLTEGELGPVRFINPVLTLSQADEDLTALVYSGLMRALPDGSLVPDLASSYSISDDGLTYTFTLRPDATFQDGKPLTSADVLYTVQTIQNPDFKSTHRADWDGVAASAPDAHTIVFKLPKAYAPFLENTTLGILPQHLWGAVTAEEFPFSPLNTHPVGSGPYKVSDSSTDSTGSATRFSLAPFDTFALGKAYLAHLTFLFYPNESAMVQALNDGRIDSIAALSPEELPSITRKDVTVLTAPLPRDFGVFYNQSHAPVLADISVRDALDAAIDKTRLIGSVLSGYGVALNSPIPPGILSPAPPHAAAVASTSLAYTDETLAAAHAILQKGGWTYDISTNTWSKKKQALQFTLATADTPQLVATANAVVAAWKALGINVNVQVYSLSELNTSIIRPRQYDALLFGEVVGRELDLFAFWHSSQRNDPGLNLSLYANSKTDSLLSKARATSAEEARQKLYQQFSDLLVKDAPATFLYAPEFIYVVPSGLHGIELGALTTPAGRFAGAYTWYIETQRVWSFFAPDATATN